MPTGESDPAWAWLESDRAFLMVGRADAPVVPDQQAVLFYLYCDDVPATRDAIERAGVAVGEIAYPSTLHAASSACTTRTVTC